MDGTNIRLTTPRILPFSTVGGSERRICMVLPLEGGAMLALQATCVLGAEPSVTVFSARRAPGDADWSAPVALAIDLPVPAALSLSVAPVLLRDGVSDFFVAWPFEGAGFLELTASGARVDMGVTVDGGGPADGGTGRITALCGQGETLYAALQGSDAAEAVIVSRAISGEWQVLAAGPLTCAAGEAVTALAVFADKIYAATANATAGFELFCAATGAGGSWETVLTRGAWRYGYNRSVTAMAVIGARLYVAADGPDLSHISIGDEHPEIMVVAADGHWQLFSGQARFTPEGLRRSVTVAGPGTPGCSGRTIGGLQGRGEDILVWLKPRAAAGNAAAGRGLVSVALWSAAEAEWTMGEPILVPEVFVTSLAVAVDGGILLAAGADVAGSEVLAGAARKPLLFALAPQ